MNRIIAAVFAIFLLPLGSAFSPALAQGFPLTFADVVDDVIPTVVVIQVQGVAPTNENPLNDLFGREAPGGTGSGFFINTDGHIVTNEHVVSLGDEISVVLQGGEVRNAEVLGVDVDTDLAVIKIDPAGLDIQAVEWADSDQIRVGDWVIAIGNPLDVGITVTHGIVSALNRDLSRANPFDQRIQTDAPINSGNSGGPSFNLDGKVIGVNQSIVSRTGGSVGLGFMIPANIAQTIVSQLRDFGEVRRGFIGINITGMSDALWQNVGENRSGGVLVEDTIPGLPGEAAGIERGDIILKFNGREVDSQEDFIFIVSATAPGTPIDLEIYRDGEIIIKTLELELRNTDGIAREDDTQTLEQLQNEFGVVVFGLTLAERLMENLARDVGGVRIVALAPTSPLANAGLQVGDIIQDVATSPVFDGAELYEALKGLKQVQITYLREGEPATAEVKLEE